MRCQGCHADFLATLNGTGGVVNEARRFNLPNRIEGSRAILWHLFCYLLWREDVDTILLKDLHGFCEVHARVRKNIVGRDLHLLSGFVHFIHSVKKATRSDDSYVVDLVRLNQERMRLAFREKHGFTGSNFEHLTFSVKANTSREDIKELIVPCVDVRRGFGTLSHLRNDEIKGPSGIGLSG